MIPADVGVFADEPTLPENGLMVIVHITCQVRIAPDCEKEFSAESLGGSGEALELRGRMWLGEFRYWQEQDKWLCARCQAMVRAQKEVERKENVKHGD